MNDISETFRGMPLPEKGAKLVGYAMFIHALDLQVCLPEKISLISCKHRRYQTGIWEIYTPRHQPLQTIPDHLTFALKYEGVELSVLKAIFEHIDQQDLIDWVTQEPTSRYSRRIWFLYEWLLGKKLALPDAKSGNFFHLIDEKLQYGGPASPSKRHRIQNNLPGTLDFCPLIRCTTKLEQYKKRNMKDYGHTQKYFLSPHILRRALALLRLQDIRASHEIDHERIAKNRDTYWACMIAETGQHPLSINELNRLQDIIIEDQRFVTLGLRTQEGMIGRYDRVTQTPLPDHIAAKKEDLDRLLNGLIETYEKLEKSQIDPVVFATIIAFGFLFIRPFEDGNGRIHRYLIHHILTITGFTPPDFILPISSSFLEKIDDYRLVLQSHTTKCLTFIDWETISQGNFLIKNETIDLYRYGDFTKHVEFLYDCIDHAIQKIIPREIEYLKSYEQLRQAIHERFDIPDLTEDLLIHFLHQHHGNLPAEIAEKYFKGMTEQEFKFLKTAYIQSFHHDLDNRDMKIRQNLEPLNLADA